MERFCHYNFFSISSSVALDTLQWVYLLQSFFVRFVGGAFFSTLHSGGSTPTEYTFTISCCINQNISVCHTYDMMVIPVIANIPMPHLFDSFMSTTSLLLCENGCVLVSVYWNSKCALIFIHLEALNLCAFHIRFILFTYQNLIESVLLVICIGFAQLISLQTVLSNNAAWHLHLHLHWHSHLCSLKAIF